jgi:hypothetical protein
MFVTKYRPDLFKTPADQYRAMLDLAHEEKASGDIVSADELMSTAYIFAKLHKVPLSLDQR